MKYQQFSKPQRLFIRAFFSDKRKKNLFVYTHKVIFDVKLKIPGPAAAIDSDLTDECSQSGCAFMDALALAAGIGIMDKDWFINGFQIIHQNMMDNPVAEISSKDLSQFWFFRKKADRTAGAVGMISQFPAKFKQFPFLIYLKPQGIDGISFIFPAEKILPVNIFKGKKQEKTLSAANG